jgi:hypothetical protein
MARTLGLGTVLGMDDDDSGSVYTTITLVVTATPPKRSRVRVAGAALSDTLESDDMGMEAKSDYVFTTFREPNDTQSAMFQTLFGNKTQIKWQITYASTDVETFEGIVSDIEPGPIVHDQFLTETITIHKKTTSTWT